MPLPTPMTPLLILAKLWSDLLKDRAVVVLDIVIMSIHPLDKVAQGGLHFKCNL
jgi:hypothetical protein